MEVTRAPTLFATHFHELTTLALVDTQESSSLATVGVANYHVGADIDSSSRKLTMLYKVTDYTAVISIILFSSLEIIVAFFLNDLVVMGLSCGNSLL